MKVTDTTRLGDLTCDEPSNMSRSTTYERVYSIVAQIPRGRVATYGQIAEIAGLERGGRQAGNALSALSDDSPIPWHRVVSARGYISIRSETGAEQIQKTLLKREGIVFGTDDRISLERFRWRLEG